jgi:hypothetical protein
MAVAVVDLPNDLDGPWLDYIRTQTAETKCISISFSIYSFFLFVSIVYTCFHHFFLFLLVRVRRRRSRVSATRPAGAWKNTEQQKTGKWLFQFQSYSRTLWRHILIYSNKKWVPLYSGVIRRRLYPAILLRFIPLIFSIDNASDGWDGAIKGGCSAQETTAESTLGKVLHLLWRVY